MKTQLELLQQLKELNEQVEAPRKQTEQWKGPTGKKQNRVPNNLPVFRSGKGIEDPLEFIEQFERVCLANAIDEPRFIVLVSLCLDSTDVQWMNKHIRDQEIPWNEFRKAFISHFQHPDATVVWQNQIRSLKMDNSGVQRYSDQFIRLATRLNWDLSHELAIYQFKLGLPGWLNKQLTTAEVA